MKRFAVLLLLVYTTRLMAQVPAVSSGTIRRYANFPSRLVQPRHVDVWLPSGYSRTRNYAVLYMHDGQMLFDSTGTWNHKEWQVDETVSRLLKTGKISDCIVVAVWNRGEYRHAEYFPQKPIAYLSTALQQKIVPELKGKAQADNYLRFLTSELKPFIDRTFSTYRDQAHTFIAGSSMGGLISMYAICEYPDVFGGAACLSTHWIGSRNMADPAIPQAFAKYMAGKLPDPRTHRLYFDYGTKMLDSLYQPLQAAVDKIGRTKGFTAKNWVTKAFVGEAHTEDAWARRLAIPLVFLLQKGAVP